MFDPLVWANLEELSRGSRSDQVKLLKHGLNRTLSPSPRLNRNDRFGEATELAVRRFQTECEIRTSGVVDRVTWAALLAALPSQTRGPQARIVPIAVRFLGATETGNNRAGNDPRMRAIFEADDYTIRRRVRRSRGGARGRPTTGKRVSTRRRHRVQTDGYPWCAAFVSLCVQRLVQSETRFRNLVPPRESSVRGFLHRWAPGQGCTIFRPGRRVLKPQVGDIAVYTFSHIGIVTSVLDRALVTIEGNTNLAGSREGTGVLLKYRSLRQVRRFIRLPLADPDVNLGSDRSGG